MQYQVCGGAPSPMPSGSRPRCSHVRAPSPSPSPPPRLRVSGVVWGDACVPGVVLRVSRWVRLVLRWFRFVWFMWFTCLSRVSLCRPGPPVFKNTVSSSVTVPGFRYGRRRCRKVSSVSQSVCCGHTALNTLCLKGRLGCPRSTQVLSLRLLRHRRLGLRMEWE